MPKRGSENSQIRKEDYDNQSFGGTDAGGTFKRASAAAMAKRKIISAKRRRPAGTSATPTAGNAGGSPPAASNPFSNFSFGGGATPAPAAEPASSKSVGFAFGSTPTAAADAPSKSVGFSFAGATPAAKPAANSNAGATPFVFGAPTPGATPGFSFGDSKSPTEVSGTNKAFSFAGATPAPGKGGFSFTGATTPAPGGFSFGGGAAKSTTSGGSGSLEDRFQKHAKGLESSFYSECDARTVSTSHILPVLDHYLDAVYVLETEWWKRSNDKANAAPAAKSVGFAAVPTPKVGGGLFGAPPPTPAPPSFGAPAAATPAADGGEDGGPSDAPSDKSAKAAAASDQDYETVGTIDGFVSFFVGGKMVVKGVPKIELHKATQKLRIVMRNDASGKVLVNMALIGKPSFTQQKHKKYINGVEGVIAFGKLSETQAEPKQIVLKKSIIPGKPTLKDIIEPLIEKYPA